MSGLLRRIKRSRAAGAGENPAEEQAAGPEGAPTTAETSAAGDATARTAEPTTRTPVIRADPDVPAGLDPAESGTPLATGRRGRLRRRLRYLRRARELMLRDLGGLFYEVHRTAGGDLASHSAVVATKVDRLSGLDAEAAAIEAALGAARSEAIVFQPGVGGTCDFCGELYGSAARFCSGCGSPTGSAVRATPAHLAQPRPVPPLPKPPAAVAEPGAEARAAEDETKVLAASDDAPAAEPTEPPADAADAAQPAKPAAEEAAAPPAAPEGTDEPKGDRDPPSSLPNGRTDDGTPPELSSGDPLTAREAGS